MGILLLQQIPKYSKNRSEEQRAEGVSIYYVASSCSICLHHLQNVMPSAVGTPSATRPPIPSRPAVQPNEGCTDTRTDLKHEAQERNGVVCPRSTLDNDRNYNDTCTVRIRDVVRRSFESRTMERLRFDSRGYLSLLNSPLRATIRPFALCVRTISSCDRSGQSCQ